MMMNNFDQQFLDELLVQARQNPLLRHVHVMKEAEIEGSQRRLKAMQPGTIIPIHQHPNSAENVFCLRGKLYEVIYRISPDPTVAAPGEYFKVTEIGRHKLCPGEGYFGCQIPAGEWHTIEVMEPAVIFESVEGKYKQDGTNYLEDYESNEVSTEIAPPQKVTKTETFFDALRFVMPKSLFSLKNLPFWCLLVTDSMITTAIGVLSMFFFVSKEPALEDLWAYLYYWIASMPLFILAMLLFRTCQGFFKKSNLANLIAAFAASATGGLLALCFCFLAPTPHFPLLPTSEAIVSTIVIAALVQTFYRLIYRLMIKTVESPQLYKNKH